MWTRAVAVATAMSGPVGAADAPLSAIDWLSESVEARSDAANGSPEISVQPLSPAPRAIGHVEPNELGVAEDLWVASSAADLARLLGVMPTDLPPYLADRLAALLVLRAPAADPEGVFLLARIDTLLAMGRLESARHLVEDAGRVTPDLFRRAFDIALLTGHENEECQRLQARPDIAPTYPARVFCLARSGDWQAAALTLETAEALDVLTPQDVALLGRFLDDGEDDMLPPPARPTPVTPLAFRLYEAIGEPLATRGLPLAFAHADLRPQNGWKTRIEAAERLFRAGAIAADPLIDLYLEQAPAASGGVWDRVAAVQAWQRAEADQREGAAAEAADALEQAGLARLVTTMLPASHDAPAERDLPIDPDIASLLAAGRTGEAALVAIARGAASWEGDADDLSRALAALDAAGVAAAPVEPGGRLAITR